MSSCHGMVAMMIDIILRVFSFKIEPKIQKKNFAEINWKNFLSKTESIRGIYKTGYNFS